MIRTFEKQILNDIHFVTRFLDARNLCIKDSNSVYKLQKKDAKDTLLATDYLFENIKNQYLTDVKDGEFNFRLMFDIIDGSVSTYIFVLKNGEFLDNGLTNLGFMLNEFDLTGYAINQNFGFNCRVDFLEYVRSMISIFEDFKNEFIRRQSPV